MELISLQTIQEIAREYGYWAIFFGIMLENAGVPLPGETITLVGGFLAGSGELTYGWVLACATGGAVIGDNIGYWIGYYGGWRLLTRLGRLFRIQETQLIRVRDQFGQNAAKAVFFGRFVALLRIFAGPLAGTVRMPYIKFLACNLAGAAIWAAAMVSLSFFVGQLVPLPTLIAWVAEFALIALGLVVFWIGVVIWLETRPSSVEQ
jgi:membrane protein DedA with SNARE-associated domain